MMARGVASDLSSACESWDVAGRGSVTWPTAEKLALPPDSAGMVLELGGLVQGVGMRPALFRLAQELQLTGDIYNSAQGVVARLAGPPQSLRAFLAQLPVELPTAGRIEDVRVSEWPVPQTSLPHELRIVPSITAAQPTAAQPTAGELTAVQLATAQPTAGELATGELTVGQAVHATSLSMPLDRRTCIACEREVNDPRDRRYRYPFATCTDCGPRYSAIESLPFDRERTSFAPFLRCPACDREYHAPHDRRFHAQTIACGECGPYYWAEVPSAAPSNSDSSPTSGPDWLARGEAALAQAIQVLRAGGIVALLGLTGYQLLTIATDESAVQRLRQLKGRRSKPLAILVSGIAQAAVWAELTDAERTALESPANPIVIVTSRRSRRLAPAVHPGLQRLGVMLPTTPLHAWLVQGAGEPLVCTSGNREGEPICVSPAEARRELSARCDLFLHHNREIVQPLDDSVVQITPWGCQVLRLGRGLAPLRLPAFPARSASTSRHAASPDSPMNADDTDLPVVALGGQMKEALAWSQGEQSVLGPHVGDLAHVRVRQRWYESLQRTQQIYRFAAECYITDSHPDYFVHRWSYTQSNNSVTEFSSAPAEARTSAPAETRTSAPAQGQPVELAYVRSRVRVVAVQHHHAHVLAGMWEAGWLDRPTLGLAWDGTGFGSDATIWGGEALLVDGAAVKRVARLRPLALYGGEQAIREPWRVASALLAQLPGSPRLSELAGFSELRSQEELLRRRFTQSATSATPVWTSSIGRLCDGISSLLLGLTHVDYDGQAAMLLEDLATTAHKVPPETLLHPVRLSAELAVPTWNTRSPIEASPSLALPVIWNSAADLWEWDWRVLVQSLVERHQAGASAAQLAAEFHHALALAGVQLCAHFPDQPIVLSGGVFQNRELLRHFGAQFSAQQRLWRAAHAIPPNDGGLAAGQLAAVWLQQR